jgi:hypothetical protein
MAGGFCKSYAKAEEKRPIQRKSLVVTYKHHANPLLSVNNYTPLVVSRKDKNKQLKLLCQRKLAETAINNFFALKIIGDPEQFKNQPRSLVRPGSVILCQKFEIFLMRQSLSYSFLFSQK